MYIYISVLQRFKKKKKKKKNYSIPFDVPGFELSSFLIRWRFPWLSFRLDVARYPKRGLAGARALFVPFAWLLMWRWCDYTARQFGALKMKKREKFAYIKILLYLCRKFLRL